jgi:exodeoxyribonuclease VII large subunit
LGIEEIVARAIFASPVPIVSAIGHEIDFTIADFVADLRAPTPSAAAELIVPDIVDLIRRIDELAACLHKCLRNFLAHEKTRLRFLSERTLTRELIKRLRDAQQQIDLTRESLQRQLIYKIDNSRAVLTDMNRRFATLPNRLYENAQQRFRRVEGILRVLGPDATLRRGYSVTTDEQGKVIKSIRAVRAQMKIRTRVSDGEFGSTVASD